MRVNFRQLALDIKRSGEIKVVAKRVGVSVQYLYMLASGLRAEPRHSIGVKLINEHKRLKR